MTKPKAKSKDINNRESAIGLRLRAAREYLGRSQKEFADSVGIKRVRLASYETGLTPIKWEIALRICRRFQISEAWLATGGLLQKDVRDAPYPFGPWWRNPMFQPGDAVLESLRPGELFSKVYDESLRLEWWKLHGKCAMDMRLDFSNNDVEEMRVLSEAAIGRWAVSLNQKDRARFLAAIIKYASILFCDLRPATPFEHRAPAKPKLEIEKQIDAEYLKRIS